MEKYIDGVVPNEMGIVTSGLGKQSRKEKLNMNTKKYQFSIESDDLAMEQFMERFHFEEKDGELLRAVGRFLTEIITVQAGVMYEEDRAVCVVTLGKRFDAIADIIAESGHLLLSYGMECFGMEFLSKSYEKLNEAVFQETGKWLGEYRFFGDEDIEEIKAELTEFRDLQVSWKNGMLHPLKSVIFSAQWKEKKEEGGCHNCEQCRKRSDCAFCASSHRRILEERENKNSRNAGKPRLGVNVYSYGIARIFGGTEG